MSQKDMAVIGRNVKQYYAPDNADLFALQAWLTQAERDTPQHHTRSIAWEGQFVTVEYAAAASETLRGGLIDADGTAIMYVGKRGSKYYYQSKKTADIPVDVLEWIEASKYVLIEGVEGGWASWDGRPEFSRNYLDTRSVLAPNLPSIIADRRGTDE